MRSMFVMSLQTGEQGNRVTAWLPSRGACLRIPLPFGHG